MTLRRFNSSRIYFTDHNKIKLKINGKFYGKSSNIFKLNNALYVTHRQLINQVGSYKVF